MVGLKYTGKNIVNYNLGGKMIFDSQEQKQLILTALGELTIKLKEAPKVLEIAQSIQEGTINEKEKDDPDIDDN